MSENAYTCNSPETTYVSGMHIPLKFSRCCGIYSHAVVEVLLGRLLHVKKVETGAGIVNGGYW